MFAPSWDNSTMAALRQIIIVLAVLNHAGPGLRLSILSGRGSRNLEAFQGRGRRAIAHGLRRVCVRPPGCLILAADNNQRGVAECGQTGTEFNLLHRLTRFTDRSSWRDPATIPINWPVLLRHSVITANQAACRTNLGNKYLRAR